MSAVAAWIRRHVVIAAVAVVAFVGVIGAFGARHPHDATPAEPGTEACAALRDPANRNLTPGDWRRIGHWSQSDMEHYVLVHCADLMPQVRP